MEGPPVHRRGGDDPRAGHRGEHDGLHHRDGILLRGLPFDEPDRIVALGTTDARGRPMGVPLPDLEDWRTSAPQFSAMALMLGAPMNLTEDGPVPEQYNGAYVTQPFLAVLRQLPVIGRDFRPDEDRPGAPPAAIISHTLWQNRYQGTADILGRVIEANTRLATIIGVMPPGMRFPFNVDVWLPYAQLPPESHTERRELRNGQGVGRLAAGVTLLQARAASTPSTVAWPRPIQTPTRTSGRSSSPSTTASPARN